MNSPLCDLINRFDRPSDSNHFRILLIGSADRIAQTTHHLHRLGFADVSDWSPILPLPNSAEMFSLLTHRKS